MIKFNYQHSTFVSAVVRILSLLLKFMEILSYFLQWDLDKTPWLSASIITVNNDVSLTIMGPEGSHEESV